MKWEVLPSSVIWTKGEKMDEWAALIEPSARDRWRIANRSTGKLPVEVDHNLGKQQVCQRTIPESEEIFFGPDVAVRQYSC
jgi:hypothetical protein